MHYKYLLSKTEYLHKEVEGIVFDVEYWFWNFKKYFSIVHFRKKNAYLVCKSYILCISAESYGNYAWKGKCAKKI